MASSALPLPEAAVGPLAQYLTSLLICACAYYVLNSLLPWIRRRRHLIHHSARLPGTPIGAASGSPWLGDISVIFSLPAVPGRPKLKLVMTWWEEQAERLYRCHVSKKKEEVEDEKEKEGDEPHGLYRIWAFNPYRVPFARCIVMVFDPHLCAEILGQGCYGQFDKGRVYGVARPLIGDSFLALPDGPEWKAQRKLAAPGFGQAVLEKSTEAVGRSMVEDVFPWWDDPASGDGFDAAKYMHRVTLDVLCEAAFSYSCGGAKGIDPRAMTSGSGDVDSDGDRENLEEKNDVSMYHAYHTITEILLLRTRSPPLRCLLPTKENRRFRVAEKTMNTTIERIIEARLREQEELESLGQALKVQRKDRDLLSQLLLKDESGTRLSRKDMLGNVRMFLFAGHDTTASTLSYALWHLSVRLDVQDRLREEVSPHFGPEGEGPSYAELRNLPLLDAVIRETLRLNCPVGISRRALRDVEIGGRYPGQRRYILPEGCEVYVYPWLVHRNPKSRGGGDLKFDPDRFIVADDAEDGGFSSGFDGNGASRHGGKDDSGRFMPFSVGPRNCLGQQLAMAEMRAVLAHIVNRYRFEPAEGAIEPVPVTTMTVQPHEVMLKFRLR